MALLAQSFRATLPQTNNQLQTSSNTQNQATIQDGRVVVQNVQGRQNQNQRYFARGNGTTGNGGAQNRAGNANADVDDEPTAQSIFMANLSSVGSANPQAGPSNASILSEVHILENAIDHSISNQDEHEIHNKVQPSDVIDTTSVHMGNSNVIPYEQYLSVNDISGVPSCASSALNSVCVSPVNDAFVPHDPIATELKNLTRKDKHENKLHSQDQSIQTVHVMLNPTQMYDQKTKTALAEVDQNEIDLRSGEIEQKNLLITNENLVAECLFKDVFYTVTDFVLNVSRFSDIMLLSHGAQKRTCPKDFSPRDKQNASTNSLRKKRVTFVEPCETSTHNTPPQVEHQKINSTNAPGIPSTGVKGASAASRSKPRSNTKKDRTLPAKSALKQVEAHSKMNKSNEKQKNHVDSSISYKRTVINSNSNTSCKTCNKCLIYVNHDQCVVRSEMFVKQSPATKVWRVKQVKQVWKAIRKLFTTISHQWRPTGRLLPLGDQWPLTMNTPSKLIHRKLLPLLLKTYDWRSFIAQEFHEKVYRDCQIRKRSFWCNYGLWGLYLEVAFRKHTCFVRNLDGVGLIKGSCGTNLYTISVDDMMRSSPICLLSKASKNKSWLWHRRLNHLNFGVLNDLARKDLVRGLPRLKFEKDHLCSACQLGKIDDYSRFIWVKFLRSKDETLAFIINLLKQLQVSLNKIVRFVRTDNGTEFVNKDLIDYYENVGITHDKTVPRTPQQNSVVERRNRTLVEAARTMLIFSKAPLFLWAEVVATACYTQNRSLIHTLHDKTPYELMHDKKSDLSFLYIFGVFCYPTNDSEDPGKLKAKADIGFFVGCAPNRKGYRIYNKRTRQIMETIHVTFDELTGQTAPVHSCRFHDHSYKPLTMICRIKRLN
ncbi:retrovirus-related pol polyprotein from transposon TNT 1-94 [Tanacetum coccineum]